MLFNSFTFLFLFLPATLLVFEVAVAAGAGKVALQILLFIASCLFIGASGLLSVCLLLFSLALNYAFLHWMAGAHGDDSRRMIMLCSVAVNLMLIAAFKYTDFLGQSFAYVSGLEIPHANLTLPLAISFYTFQLIALTVDNWRNRQPCPTFSRLALFVAFFPQLIAGPIVRYGEIEKFLDGIGLLKAKNLAIGATIFGIGLFKKAVLADGLAPAANTFFNGVEGGAVPTLFEAWAGALTYTFQIYFDFSGYSDMAVGLAFLFGIRLPANFYSPYRATSIIEFWRRWHMTLSSWLRDYLYIPLGGNRGGVSSRWRNVFITMMLGGLWHGASWNFVLWGCFHGLLIAANHAARHFGIRTGPALGWVLTFFVVVLGWVIFRTTDVESAMRIYSGLFGFNGIELPARLESSLGEILKGLPSVTFGASELIRIPAVVLCVFTGVIALLFPNSEQLFWERELSAVLTSRTAFVAGVIMTFGVFGIHQAVPFVYFRF
jgi:alginate O-acetyltransferase complex protein AlgI